ncbi:hypothetical protein LVISKB_0680 [Levilactobacillus brevis KB290]|uniref:Uncharacterized protein n=1 Tax=Levilactobacillus brevis KB290 TaxID=1001583 RepID=M5AD21_LEVBR|nr:hypothetical protein LVISKB_0680 [Levilactobacillus brevis KB290]
MSPRLVPATLRIVPLLTTMVIVIPMVATIVRIR